MVAAKNRLNFVQDGEPLSARLPIPEHDKALTAHTATALGVSVCALAENLHRPTSFDRAFPATKETVGHSPYR